MLTGHTDWVEAVAIAPDSTWLASAGYDGTVRIWDTTGRVGALLTGEVESGEDHWYLRDQMDARPGDMHAYLHFANRHACYRRRYCTRDG